MPAAPPSFVFFDIETTGLDRHNAEVIQIAAKCGDEKFVRQILPTNPLPQIITDITGISVEDGVMRNRNGEVLDTVSKEEAMKSFLEYLSKFDGGVILIAHNGHYFDGPIITRTMKEVALIDEFEKLISGFSDTFPIFKNYMPGRFSQGKNYKLPALADEFLGINDGLHEAMNDVEALEKLTQHERISVADKDFVENCKSITEIIRRLQI